MPIDAGARSPAPSATCTGGVFLSSTSANTLIALGVVTLGNLHWWPYSYKHKGIYCMCRLQLALCGGGSGGGGIYSANTLPWQLALVILFLV